MILPLHARKPALQLQICACRLTDLLKMNRHSFLFYYLLCLLCSSHYPVLIFLLIGLSPTRTLMRTTFAYPPLPPEVCEVVGACESRHTGRGSCVPHLKPFAHSMLSASIWIRVCACVRVCVCARMGVSVCASVGLCAYICLRVNDQEWFRGMSVGALLALRKMLFLCAHMWARPCGCRFVHIQLSQSPHIYI